MVAEFPESLVSDSKRRVSRLRTRISLGLGIEGMDLNSLGIGIEVYKRGDSESESESRFITGETLFVLFVWK